MMFTPFNIHRLRKEQIHTIFTNIYRDRGGINFESFSPLFVLRGDIWYSTSENYVLVNDVIINKGDKVRALVDNPGSLNYININAGKWLIEREINILYGTRKSKIHGGYLMEQYMDDDYMYICSTAGVPETYNGSNDGTAIWKKIHLLLT